VSLKPHKPNVARRQAYQSIHGASSCAVVQCGDVLEVRRGEQTVEVAFQRGMHGTVIGLVDGDEVQQRTDGQRVGHRTACEAMERVQEGDR